MKRKIALATCLLILFTLLSGIISSASSASFTGTTNVRAGERITLSLNATGNGLYGFEGDLVYNNAHLTLVSYNTALPNWKLELNGNKFVLYDDTLDNSLTGTKTIMTIVFDVKSNVTTGTAVEVGINNLIGTDGSKETSYASPSYKTTILAPRSSDANLAALTVSNANISPAFNPNTTVYSTTVPFSTRSLQITARTNNSGASYAISSNSLAVGDNTVYITVTAENGAKKYYSINVKREQDPNYVESSNTNLKEIIISNGILSPKFEPSKSNYVVYLPYEIEKITLGGITEDAKSSVKSEEYNLDIGDNELVIKITAEDGSTKDYEVKVIRMPLYTGDESNPDVSEPDESEPDESEPDESDDESEPMDEESDESSEESRDETKIENNKPNFATKLIVGIVVGILILALGIIIVRKIIVG